MRTKFNILMCALFVLALAVSQVHAQDAYRLGATRMDVVQSGNNQTVGAVILRNIAAADATQNDVARNTSDDKVDISFMSGGAALVITSMPTPLCDATAVTVAGITSACDAATVLAASDDKKKATLTVNDASSNILLNGFRVDVSSLDADAAVTVMLSSADAGGVDFGDGAGLSASRQVATVKAGIAFKVTTGSRLYCSDSGEVMGMVKVTEGFNSAWEAEGATDAATPGSGMGATHIKFKINNVPSGVSFIWPGQDHDDAMGTPTITMDLDAGTAETEVSEQTVAQLMFVPSGLSTDTTEAVYKFMPTDYTAGQITGTVGDSTAVMHKSRKDEFELTLVVAVDAAKAGAGGTADIWGWLHPAAGFEDLGSKLSYTMMPATDPKSADTEDDDGDILAVSECVTYLLYPFVTCGATEGWTTGLSVANTSGDDMVFGEKKGAANQSGAVTLYGYPKSAKAADGSSGEMMDPFMMMLSPNLMYGDTLATSCPMSGMGWEGYAIVRAGFRHAHGAAFVLSTAGGSINAAHGYMALVIPDPSFGGMRGSELSESLDQ